MIDLDYPKQENPCEAEFVHWLIPNIPADSFKIGTPTGSKPTLGYSPPMPLINSGEHRFVLLLFAQERRRISVPTMKKRNNFSLKEFIQKHNLGEPLAGNYFLANHGD
uniref:Phosphatidylethanolamine-binding protein n=1 Tax=Romanomermis culicivorax TaxID=13658 RepID=A0A915JAF5_ROMCU